MVNLPIPRVHCPSSYLIAPSLPHPSLHLCIINKVVCFHWQKPNKQKAVALVFELAVCMRRNRKMQDALHLLLSTQSLASPHFRSPLLSGLLTSSPFPELGFQVGSSFPACTIHHPKLPMHLPGPLPDQHWETLQPGMGTLPLPRPLHLAWLASG